MRRIAALVVLCFCASVSPATASDLLTSPELARAQAVAGEVWGNPCGSVVGTRWGSSGNPAWIAQAAYDFPGWPPDPAQFTDCAVVFNPDQAGSIYLTEPDRVCTVVVHEYGHLAGQMSDDPGTANYVDIAAVHPACVSPAPPVLEPLPELPPPFGAPPAAAVTGAKPRAAVKRVGPRRLYSRLRLRGRRPGRVARVRL